jgi:hypothetical protein
MSVMQILLPTHQNQTQRVGFFSAILLSILSFFLHYPFGGYQTTLYVSGTYGSGGFAMSQQCMEIIYRDLKTLTADDLSDGSDYRKRYDACVEEANAKLGRSIELPFWLWASKEAVMPWFASLGHLFSVLGLLAAIGALWLWIFKTKETTQTMPT